MNREQTNIFLVCSCYFKNQLTAKPKTSNSLDSYIFSQTSWRLAETGISREGGVNTA